MIKRFMAAAFKIYAFFCSLTYSALICFMRLIQSTSALHLDNSNRILAINQRNAQNLLL